MRFRAASASRAGSAQGLKQPRKAVIACEREACQLYYFPRRDKEDEAPERVIDRARPERSHHEWARQYSEGEEAEASPALNGNQEAATIGASPSNGLSPPGPQDVTTQPTGGSHYGQNNRD